MMGENKRLGKRPDEEWLDNRPAASKKSGDTQFKKVRRCDPRVLLSGRTRHINVGPVTTGLRVPGRRRRASQALQKARQHDFYLGLDSWKWLENRGSH